ncbi:PREDICTED: threonine dehydratase biosynthetic, chloroplastic-like [Ipomoea nil]|uniref:threonine dehydratase biosynthetic, chloroplastic-like n=1 Tax=Ipomoea nil TaxID=35883 RepID=UPI000900EF59|nr:PREDICTED: threonine dehydratase biosynthetic, chloroplastic-like [Ipomoea nil]
MDVLRFATTQSPYLLCKPLPPAAAIAPNYTVKAGDVRRASSGAFLIRAAVSRPEAPVLSTTPTAAKKQLRSDDLPVVSWDSLTSEPGRLVENPGYIPGNDSFTYEAVDYLTAILSTKVYDVALRSPLQLASKLTERLGNNIWFKREDLQPIFSFKIRGAYNMMAKLTKEELDKGVICASAGNHAQGVALSAQKLGCDAVIVMPVTTPEIKWRSVEALGATVVLEGDSFDDAQAYAQKRADEEGRKIIPPFDHRDIIAGQGTVGKEILNQARGPIHAIFVPIGGGGLIAGLAAFVKMVNPDIKIIGVEPHDANSMALALHHGHRVMLDQVGSFADGVAVKAVGKETFRLSKELIDGVVFVGRDEMAASIKDMFEERRNILEPSGALSIAGAEAYCKYYNLKGENIIVVTSGANMNFDRLRCIAELADVGGQREAILSTNLPEEPGSFKKFVELVGPMNITEFRYRYSSGRAQSLVLYRVSVHTKMELDAMVERMILSDLHTIDLTDNDLVKDHLRHLIGGRCSVEDELLCRFIFPERPGALLEFLDAFSPQWNITLFNYRAHGEAGANVLVGLQVPSNEIDEFKQRANDLGYEYAIETSEAFQLLMN